MRFTCQHSNTHAKRGFTIIELLVVIGIIVLFLTLAGLSIRGTDNLSLQSAQRTMSGLVNAARSQAEMRQTTVYIAVNDDPTDADNYLRQIWLVRQGDLISPTPPANYNWIPIGDPVRLPAGVFIVPTPNTVGTTTHRTGTRALLGTFFSDYIDNPSHDRKSNAIIDEIHINHHPTNNNQPVEVMVISFNSRGFAGRNYRFIAALAERQQGGPRFNNSEQITGMFIRPFGSTVLVNDARTFDTN